MNNNISALYSGLGGNSTWNPTPTVPTTPESEAFDTKQQIESTYRYGTPAPSPTNNTDVGTPGLGGESDFSDIQYKDKMFSKGALSDNADVLAMMNGTYSPKSINRNDKRFASKTQGELAKAEYSDWTERYKPYEQKLVGLSEGYEILNQQLSQISADTLKANKRKQRIRDTLQSRLGIQTSALQQKSIDRQDQLSMALAQAKAENNSRVAVQDIQNSILTGTGYNSQRSEIGGE